jgi:hypothetical protein
MMIPPPLGDLPGGLHDPIRLFGGQQTQFPVHQGGGLLENPERPDDLLRHPLLAQVEVLQGPRGLRPIVGVRGDLYLTHRVVFGSELHGHPVTTLRTRPPAVLEDGELRGKQGVH